MGRRVLVRTGFVAIAFLFLNVVSLQLRSSGGLLEALGVMRCADCVRAWGFPLEVWRSGGYIGYVGVVRFDALLIDIAVALVVSVVVGVAWARLANRREQ